MGPGKGMRLLRAHTQLSIVFAGMCWGIIPWASSCGPAHPVPAAEVGTWVPAAEGEQQGPDLLVH